jgi:hypothetical protein
LQVAVLTLPGFVLVWLIARREFGDGASCVALAALLCTGYYLREAFRVRLDVPLATVSMAVLWACHRATTPGRGRGAWLAALGLLVFASLWVKYQAVCVVAAVALYSAIQALQKGRAGLRRTWTPLAVTFYAALCGVASIVAYFVAVGGSASLADGLSMNLARFAVAGEGTAQSLAAFRAVVSRGIVNTGAPLIVLSMLGLAYAPRVHPLAMLLACYCLATAAFNAVTFRLPGAGGYQLHAMIPALAVLTGYTARQAAEGPGVRRRALLVGLLLAWQIASNRPALTWPGRTPRPEMAAARRIALGEAGGVLALDCRAEFYADRPVALMQYMRPGDVLDCVAGEGPHVISHVLIPPPLETPPRDSLGAVWPQVVHLLKTRFVQASLPEPGLLLFERSVKALVQGPERWGAPRPAGDGHVH